MSWARFSVFPWATLLMVQIVQRHFRDQARSNSRKSGAIPMKMILLLFATGFGYPDAIADTARVWYCPFGINVNNGVNSRLIEDWHELTSLIGDSGLRLEEIAKTGQKSKEFRDWDVRIKLLHKGTTTLIDGLGNVKRGKLVTTLPQSSMLDLQAYLVKTFPPKVVDVEFSPHRKFPRAPRNYKPVVVYKPGAFSETDARDVYDVTSLVKEHRNDIYNILSTKGLAAQFDASSVWLLVVDHQTGLVEVDTSGNCRNKGETWAMSPGFLKHLKNKIIWSIPGRPQNPQLFGLRTK